MALNLNNLLSNETVIKALMDKIPEPYITGALDSASEAEKELTRKVFDIVSSEQASGEIKKKAFPKQLGSIIIPILFNYLNLNRKASLLCGEMGIGKTLISFYTLYLYSRLSGVLDKGVKALMVTDGSKLLGQMADEASFTIPKDRLITYFIKSKDNLKKGEITMSSAIKVERIPGKIILFILSKDTGKNELKTDGTFGYKKCPHCGKFIGKDKQDNKKYYECINCNTPVWTTVGGKVSVAKELSILSANSKDKFLLDFFIADEVHKFQSPDSLQTKTYRALVKHSRRVLLMTGTLSNGYASSIFHIIYPSFAPELKAMGFGYEQQGQFIDFFGSKSVTKSTSQRKGNRTTRVFKELPEINYRAISALMGLGLIATTASLNLEMPEYHEGQIIVPLESNVRSSLREIKDQMQTFMNGLEKVTSGKHNIENYTLNNFHKDYSFEVKGKVIDFETQAEVEVSQVFNFRPWDVEEPNYISAKERKLIELVQKEVNEGRRIILYTDRTESNDVQNRLLTVLTSNGINADALPKTIKSENILKWLTDFKGEVVILPQRRVETGLNLVMFHTVIFYEMSDQIRVIQQAKSRPWRPFGQEKDVRVFFLVYEGAQARQLASIGSKMASTTVVSGNRIEDGTLANLYDYQASQTLAIRNAEQIVVKLSDKKEKFEFTPFEQMYDNFLKQLKGAKSSARISFEEELKAISSDGETTTSIFEADKMIEANNLFHFDDSCVIKHKEIEEKKARIQNSVRAKIRKRVATSKEQPSLF